MKKLCLSFLAILFSLGLASCGEENGGKEYSVTPKDFVATRADNRESVYTHYSVTGEKIDEFTSLYAAINSCVNDGDIEDYILKEGSEEKIFINYEKYAEDSVDMYWYYEGDSLKKYTMWEKTYWNELNGKDYIGVLKSGANGSVSIYSNGYAAVNKSSNFMLPKLGQVFHYHICEELEANATVDMVAYSGITKSEYTIKLSEAEITPAYDGGDTVYAYFGFVTSDAYNISHNGLKCDTTTGNWYYYSGEVDEFTSNVVTDLETCYLTSTWDAEKGCFRPDGDVKMTMELLTLEDEDGDSYIAHRMTMDFGNGNVVVKDYETSQLTQCGTIRFTSGLDIESENTLVDYMCGAKFENLVITSAKATVLEEMMNDAVYGYIPELYAGEYDILNSNPETLARFHTIIYNSYCVKYDFNTPGKDVYSYSFDN